MNSRVRSDVVLPSDSVTFVSSGTVMEDCVNVHLLPVDADVVFLCAAPESKDVYLYAWNTEKNKKDYQRQNNRHHHHRSPFVFRTIRRLCKSIVDRMN